MYNWRPAQWIKWAPLTILPFIAGAWLQTDGVVSDVVARAQAAAGDWAKVKVEGRDATITGQVESQEVLDAAKKALENTYGIRTVDLSAVKIVAPVPLAAPTIEPLTSLSGLPEIKGTWPQDLAKTLSVTLNGKTYDLGKDAELQSTAGNWVLKPTTAIPDGAYDVTASVSDGGKLVTAAAAPVKLVVNTAPPPAAVPPVVEVPVVEAPVVVPPVEPEKPAAIPLPTPTASAISTNEAAPTITGTYAKEAAKLMVDLAGKSYVLGTDKELEANASGIWTLKPAPLADGSYTITARVEDAAGTATASLPHSFTIDTVAPVAATLNPPTPDAVWPYVINGSVPSDAKDLTIALNGKTYAMGKDKELVDDGKGAFAFAPVADLKPGKYGLDLTVTDAVNNVTKTTVPDAIVVPEPVVTPPVAALAAPTVEAATSQTDMPIVKGTFDANSKGLTVTLGGQVYVLGKDEGLVSATTGTWTLTPAKPLKNGTYDVVTAVDDGAGAMVKDKTVGELTVEVPPPPPPPAALDKPTVENAVSETNMPMVMGTWPAKTAKTLTVALDGTSYVLGKDAELTSDSDGRWMLMSRNAIPNGTYNVVAYAEGEAGQTARDATQGELVVNMAVAPPPVPPAPVPPAPVAPAPALSVPTVESSTSDSDHPLVKGTWPAGKANSLVVTLDGTSYKLGTNFELLSDASGNWTLKPKLAIVNGTYDVIAQIADAAGQTAIDATKGELVVNVAPPPPPPPAAQAYDCVATMARISAVFPVRFQFNRNALVTPNDLATNQYVALLKDPRCLTLKIQVAGHADYLGSEKYNQGLSERRAQTVIDTLVKAGVTADRLTAVGYSKDKPLDPALTDSARAKNRRVEFTVLN